MKLVRLYGTLVAFSLALTSSLVLAEPVHDCSGGCWIVTCGGSSCTLWRCDATGCTVETTFPNNLVRSTSPESPGDTFGASTTACTTERCVVKVCELLECSLYGLDGNRSSLLGRLGNADGHLCEIARAFMEAPRDKGSDSR